jgi:hypothetical protein
MRSAGSAGVSTRIESSDTWDTDRIPRSRSKPALFLLIGAAILAACWSGDASSAKGHGPCGL